MALKLADWDSSGIKMKSQMNVGLLVFGLLLAVTSGIPQTEIDALQQFATSTGFSSWTNNKGWVLGADPCPSSCSSSTFGESLTCGGETGNCHVISIALDSNNLSGTIPDAIVNLTQLVSLSLASNSIRGPLPANLFTMSKLEGVNLKANPLQCALPELGGAALKVVNLDSTQVR